MALGRRTTNAALQSPSWHATRREPPLGCRRWEMSPITRTGKGWRRLRRAVPLRSTTKEPWSLNSLSPRVAAIATQLARPQPHGSTLPVDVRGPQSATLDQGSLRPAQGGTGAAVAQRGLWRATSSGETSRDAQMPLDATTASHAGGVSCDSGGTSSGRGASATSSEGAGRLRAGGETRLSWTGSGVSTGSVPALLIGDVFSPCSALGLLQRQVPMHCPCMHVQPQCMHD
jgi:hypothetical protein